MQTEDVAGSVVSEQRTRIFTNKPEPMQGLCILIEDGIPCSAPVASRGLCNRHRAYMTFKGLLETYALPRQSQKFDLKPNHNPQEGICAVLERGIPCEELATRRGLCRRHYVGIWQRPDLDLNDFAKPETTIIYSRSKSVEQGRCVVREYSNEKYVQCKGDVIARGLCKRHYHVLSQDHALFEQIANPLLKPTKIRKNRPTGKVKLDRDLAAEHGVQVRNEPGDAERFLSPNEIGKILNVTGEAVKQWIYHRRLPAVKMANGYWKVRVRDFEAFLKSRSDGVKMRVLVTGSRDGRMNVVVDAVQALGHEAVVAHSLVDALLKSMEHYPALFVINLTIKNVDPWKLAEKIRTTKPLRKFPILFVAESDMTDSDAEKALKLGAQGFLRLPADTATLAAEIKRIVNRTG